MVFAKTVHYTKQQAEQLRQGANSTKTHLSNPLPKKHLDPQELLAWELEQEKWADKSDSAILENPGWQRVGIKFNTSRGQSQSYSGYSSSEEEQSRQSPDVIRSTSSMQMERPYIRAKSPAPSASAGGPTENIHFLYQDQRKIANPRALSPANFQPIASMMSNYSNLQQPYQKYSEMASQQSLTGKNTDGSSLLECHQEGLRLVASWNSNKADELEAEFQRLEASRIGSFAGSERRDENNEGNVKEIIVVEDIASEDIIHLEDQDSFEEEQEYSFVTEGILKRENIEKQAKEKSLEAECEALRKQEARMQTRLQEKLDQLEGGGLAVESETDVSQYPRLQQIRMKRKERLTELETIRRERAQIWDMLEANWEQVEKNMVDAREVATEYLMKAESTATSAKDNAADEDSLKLSASERSANEDEPSNDDLAGIALVVEVEDTITTPASKPTADLVALLASMNAGVNEEKEGDSRAVVQESKNTSSRPINFADAVEIPLSTSGLLESTTADAKKADDAVFENSSRKEDPPTNFGEFLQQKASNVGMAVANAMKSVGSVDGKQQQLKFQRTETCEEETTNLGAFTDTFKDDEGSDLERELGTFKVADPESEVHGCSNALTSFWGKKMRDSNSPVSACVNPLQGLFVNQRRIVMDGDNPCTPGFNKIQAACNPRQTSPTMNKRTISFDPSTIDPSTSHRSLNRMQSNQSLPSAYSDSNYDVEVESDDSVEEGREKSPKGSKSDEKTIGVTEKFFSLVEDILVNSILNIADKDAMNDIARSYGFT